MNKNTIETIVGTIVILIAVIFLVFAYQTVDFTTKWGGYQISARFDNASGITVGSDIRLAGVKIGSVTQQKLDTKTYQSVITMTLDNAIPIPDDSTARITAEGLLGSMFIELEPGASETNLAQGGEIDFTQSGIDMWDIIGKFIFNNANAE